MCYMNMAKRRKSVLDCGMAQGGEGKGEIVSVP